MNKENPDTDGVYFYYLRDINRHPIGGVCLKKVDSVWCRGVSVCSMDDKFDKDEARKKARSRLIHAMFAKKSDYRSRPNRSSTDRAFYYVPPESQFFSVDPYKSMYDAHLSIKEMDIVEEE